MGAQAFYYFSLMGSVWCSFPIPSANARVEPGRLIIAGTAAIGAFVVVAPWLFYERAKRHELELEVLKHKETAERQTRLRDEERRGRTRAEQRLRQAALHNPSEKNGESTVATTNA